MNTSQVNSVVNFFYENADKRIRDRFLMGNPYQVLLIYASYAIFCGKVLPIVMKNQKPWNYRILMTVVDLLVWLRSLYFATFGSYAFGLVYSWRCQPVDLSDTWAGNTAVDNGHYYVVSQLIYMLQSVVFVTCKKDKSVGTYLLLHHMLFPISIWLGVNFHPGGHPYFIGFVNSVVHFIVTSIRLHAAVYSNGIVSKKAKKMDVYAHVSQ